MMTRLLDLRGWRIDFRLGANYSRAGLWQNLRGMLSASPPQSQSHPAARGGTTAGVTLLGADADTVASSGLSWIVLVSRWLPLEMCRDWDPKQRSMAGTTDLPSALPWTLARRCARFDRTGSASEIPRSRPPMRVVALCSFVRAVASRLSRSESGHAATRSSFSPTPCSIRSGVRLPTRMAATRHKRKKLEPGEQQVCRLVVPGASGACAMTESRHHRVWRSPPQVRNFSVGRTKRVRKIASDTYSSVTLDYTTLVS